MLGKFTKYISKLKTPYKDTYSIIYHIPDHISNDEAEEREGFIDMCFSKSNLDIVRKGRLDEYLDHIIQDNKYYYEFHIRKDNENETLSVIIDAINKYISAITVSSLNIHKKLSFVFGLENHDSVKYMIIHFIKEKEKWYMDSIERG